MGGAKSGLLNVKEIVGRIAIESYFTNWHEGILLMGPNLNKNNDKDQVIIIIIIIIIY